MSPSPYDLPTRWLEWHTLADVQVREEREQCCKDICVGCEEGFNLVHLDDPQQPLWMRWLHLSAAWGETRCHAAAIRERAWKKEPG
jgi:hypothetical protein